jgi:hypothetical protein
MIDRDVLRQLGWSDQLIDAVSQAAEPLRRSVVAEEISAPVEQVLAVSTTAIYSEAVANNTFRAITVSSQVDPKESTNSAA